MSDRKYVNCNNCICFVDGYCQLDIGRFPAYNCPEYIHVEDRIIGDASYSVEVHEPELLTFAEVLIEDEKYDV